ncbi:MAG: UDP-N-acetylmuramate--L-alanine ligase [Candidatus Latescibacterota bacterium]
MKPLFARYARVHMVGIGGAGMEGLARLLAAMGATVSGSDRADSEALAGLRRDGFPVKLGHEAAGVEGADLVVYSAAVPQDNPELEAARQRGIPQVGRAEVLGEVSRLYLTLAVAGSHGKTTTASMAADILVQAGWEPSVLVGGWRRGRVHARLGSGRFLVAEADEFRRAFLSLYPSFAVVTSVDAEHLDCYADLGAVEEAFCAFLERLPFYGHALVSGDGTVGRRLLEGAGRPRLTYGLGRDNHYRATAVAAQAWGSGFCVWRGDERLGEITLRVPGEHNVRNALGAAALCHSIGVDFATIGQALSAFGGVQRRFEVRGEAGGVLVVDDYAHHPTEITAALQTARRTGRRVLAAFQPHLYSRTQALSAGFAQALCAADQVVLTEIYPSREEPIPGVDAGLIAGGMRALGYRQVERVADLEALTRRLLEACRSGDLVITLGAGDITGVPERLLQGLAAAAAGPRPARGA